MGGNPEGSRGKDTRMAAAMGTQLALNDLPAYSVATHQLHAALRARIRAREQAASADLPEAPRGAAP